MTDINHPIERVFATPELRECWPDGLVWTREAWRGERFRWGPTGDADISNRMSDLAMSERLAWRCETWLMKREPLTDQYEIPGGWSAFAGHTTQSFDGICSFRVEGSTREEAIFRATLAVADADRAQGTLQ